MLDCMLEKLKSSLMLWTKELELRPAIHREFSTGFIAVILLDKARAAALV